MYSEIIRFYMGQVIVFGHFWYPIAIRIQFQICLIYIYIHVLAHANNIVNSCDYFTYLVYNFLVQLIGIKELSLMQNGCISVY